MTEANGFARHSPPDTGDHRPHDPESERGLLGCILLDPDSAMQAALEAGVTSDTFWATENALVWRAAHELKLDLHPISDVTVTAALRQNGDLAKVGGPAYIGDLLGATPGATLAPYFIEQVRAKEDARRMLSGLEDALRTLRESPDGGGLSRVREQVELCTRRAERDSDTAYTFRELLGYDVDADPNALIGIRHDGRPSRWICKGYGAWLIGPSGHGKSSLALQMGVVWCLGSELYGIRALRPLRVLMVQAENDIGDLAEGVQGIAKGMHLSDADTADLQDRLAIVTIRGKTHRQFCEGLQRRILAHRADIVIVDPLLSFAGIDVARQEQVTTFLRQCLDPVLHATGAALIGVHHTGKPKDQKSRVALTAMDHAYSGIGSSELVNWARAIMVIVPHEGGRGVPTDYELKMAKRAERAGAVDLDGTPIRDIWLRHSTKGICWEQQQSPEEPAPKTEGNTGGRASKVDELITLGLGLVIDGLVEATGKNEVARRIEQHAAKLKMDISLNTAKKAVEKLVQNGAIKKTESGYLKA